MKATTLLLLLSGPVVLKDDCCINDPDTTGGESTSVTSSSETGSETLAPTTTIGESSESTGSTSTGLLSDTDAPTTGEPSLCGNGVLDPGEECEGEDLCHTCLRDRVIFVTGLDNRWTGGELGGMPGADEKCNVLARTHGLDGPDGTRRFRAWLSSETSNIADRALPSAGRYVRVDGQVVADSWAALLAGDLQAPPRITAGGADAFDEPVWTGTVGVGGVWGGPGSCDGWTTSRGLAIRGVSAANGPGWSEWQDPVPCTLAQSLYCVEQEETTVCHLGACTSTADCPFGAECFPLVNNANTLLCGLPCKTDAACSIACTEGQPEPFTHCGETGLCEPVLCDEQSDCDCQPWLNGLSVCFSPPP